MESWLATYSPTSRERALDLYLRNIPEQHRESERQKLLMWAKFAQPLPIKPGSFGPLTLERKVVTTLKTTLFVFSAPKVEGCEVALQTYTAKGRTAEWVVGLWVGGAVRKTAQTSLRSTFVVGPGQHKRVFLQVPVVVTFRYAFIPGKAARLPTGTAAALLSRVAGELSTSLFHRATASSLTPLPYNSTTDVEPLPERSAPGSFLETMSAPAPGAESIKPSRTSRQGRLGSLAEHTAHPVDGGLLRCPSLPSTGRPCPTTIPRTLASSPGCGVSMIGHLPKPAG
jgi:hypothetical protein